MNSAVVGGEYLPPIRVIDEDPSGIRQVLEIIAIVREDHGEWRGERDGEG